jgi:glyceraldehyde 3-phosphate dehydrogenase
MKKKIAINGFGRIGRIVFRGLINDPNIQIVAINDLSSPEELAYLLKYDSVHGTFDGNISYNNDLLIVNKKKIKILSEKDALNLPWKKMNIDLVLECTGLYTNIEDANKHIEAGAKHVVISAPGKGDMKTIVFGVNHKTLTGNEKVISAASCTTNALAPILKVINDKYEINSGYMSTIHAYTNDQVNLDVCYKKGYKSRRGRACAVNIIPTSTGAASAIGKVIPSLEGKMKGNAFRVPISDGSMLDISLNISEKVSKEDINKLLKSHANESYFYTEDPIVSSDIINLTAGGIVDGLLTEVINTNDKSLIKIIGWYDNEYSYSMQMIRTIKYFLKKSK